MTYQKTTGTDFKIKLFYIAIAILLFVWILDYAKHSFYPTSPPGPTTPQKEQVSLPPPPPPKSPEEVWKEDKEIVSIAEKDILEKNKDIKKYYLDMPHSFHEIDKYYDSLVMISNKYKKEKEPEKRELSQKASHLVYKAEMLKREIMAKSLEAGMLKKGYSIEVNAVGAKKDVLEIKWPPMNKSFAYRIINDNLTVHLAKSLGFQKIYFKGVLDNSWSLNLREQ